MKKINLHNYEAFLLDEMEGRLSAELREELHAFLLAHPHLDPQPSDGELPKLFPDIVTCPEGQSLYKDQPSELEVKVLSYLEGEMDPGTRLKFEKEISINNELKRLVQTYRETRLVPSPVSIGGGSFLRKDMPTAAEEQALRYTEGLMSAQEALLTSRDAELMALVDTYQKCHFAPDEIIVFPDQSSLLRTAKVIRLSKAGTLVRMAAAVLLIALLGALLLPRNSTAPENKSSARISPPSPAKNDALPSEKNVESAEQPPVQQLAVLSEKKLDQVVSQQSSAPAVEPPAIELRAGTDLQPDLTVEKGKTDSVPQLAGEFKEPLTTVSDLNQLAWTEEREHVRSDNKFWEKAAGMLGKLKRLGLRGVDAREEERVLTMSINQLSVEKKYATE